ncbi:unnamed protein product [Arabidopsis halleri]
MSKSKKEEHSLPIGALSQKSEICLTAPPRYPRFRHASDFPEVSTHHLMTICLRSRPVTWAAAVHDSFLQTKGILGFCLLDWSLLGPKAFISRPIIESCNPTLHSARPRSDFSKLLHSSLHMISRYNDLTGLRTPTKSYVDIIEMGV